jgi:hypothetical protein
MSRRIKILVLCTVSKNKVDESQLEKYEGRQRENCLHDTSLRLTIALLRRYDIDFLKIHTISLYDKYFDIIAMCAFI